MKIQLRNVRLSFPHLFKPEVSKKFPDKEPKFSATFLLDKDKDADQIAKIRTAIKEVSAARWPGGMPKGLRLPVNDGDEKEYDGYKGMLYIKASTDRQPPIVNRDMTVLREDEDVIFGGCYVNAAIDLWTYDNISKGISATLRGVQYVRRGEPFGDKFDINAEFAPVSGDGDTADAADVPDADLPF